jgi:hypothetical protein
MSIYHAIGLTVLPHIGGFAGGLITRKQIKTWFEVNMDSYLIFKI